MGIHPSWLKPLLFLLTLLVLSLFLSLSVQAQDPGADSAGPLTPAATTMAPTAAQEAALAAWEALPVDIQAKVDRRILAEFSGEEIPSHLSALPGPRLVQPLEKTRFLVYLTARSDLSALEARVYASATDQRSAVLSELVNTAQASQAPLRALLDGRQQRNRVAAYQPFYIVNAIAIEGDLDTVVELAQRADVARLVASYPLLPLRPAPKQSGESSNEVASFDKSSADAATLLPWNITDVRADRVWQEFGITGEGTVVGGFDTGVNYLHPALRKRYRGFGANSAYQHDYSWFEPDAQLYPNGSLGPSVSTEPYDCDTYNTHGTHTMGTMVGDGGTPATAIGVAPGARWVAVPGICSKTMPGTGISDDIGGLKAFQWFLCPTDLTGELATADCSLAPDVINNSWGSANPVDDTFRPAIQALRVAGISVVFAAGNTGLGGSIGSPAHLVESTTVGATDEWGELAYFSSQGPSYSNLELKPNISAPGDWIRSSIGTSGYSDYSGTSMAAPHVAGLIALLIEADLLDGLRDFNVDELEAFLTATARDLGQFGPDYEFGAGLIDAHAAVRWALSAGDLRGTVLDSASGEPIAGIQILGKNAKTGETFNGVTGASGIYSLTVPSGSYDMSLQGWAYESATYANQRVIAGALSTTNFSMNLKQTGVLTGQIEDGTMAVSGAHLYVADLPSVGTTVTAEGSYSLRLPVGQHGIVVEADGYQRFEHTISVAATGTLLNVRLDPAPSILLVDADASAGWFYGWPVYPFMERALDKYDYLYDLWHIDYTTFTDTRTVAGSVRFGIPSAQTMLAYDVVVWMHSGCTSDFYYDQCWWGNPQAIDAVDELSAFLEQGGRLLISGQDIGVLDGDHGFYDQMLRADSGSDYGSYAQGFVVGTEFFDGLKLALTNASFYASSNSAALFSPDTVESDAQGGSYPVLTYGGQNGAALAIAPCDADYRAIYLAMGYENVAHRNSMQDPSVFEIVERSIDWLGGTQMPPRYRLRSDVTEQVTEAGRRLSYEVMLDNTGMQEIKVKLSLSSAQWPAQILSGGIPLNGDTIVLSPCMVKRIQLSLEVPEDVKIGTTDTVTLTVSPIEQPELPSYSESFMTKVFSIWQPGTPLPTSRTQGAYAAVPEDDAIFVFGGYGTEESPVTNHRYNACADIWEPRAPLPVPLFEAAAATVGGKIYIAGGLLLTSDYFGSSQSLYIYDPATNEWGQGADLPWPAVNSAAAVVDGKIYLLGGYSDYEDLEKIIVYDPASDQWSEGGTLPSSFYGPTSAASMNGEIFILGGSSLSIYNPATDTWRTGTSPSIGRYATSLIAAPDGYLYAAAGITYSSADSKAVERYDPQTDSWDLTSFMNNGSRYDAASGYAAGRLVVIGGNAFDPSTEFLTLTPSFCNSALHILQPAIDPGGVFDLQIDLIPDPVDRPSAQFTAPLPPGVSFVAFIENPLGATYNEVEQRVEWRGLLPAGTEPLRTVYTLRSGGDLQSGARITPSVVFENGNGTRIERMQMVGIFAADFSLSTKRSSTSVVLSGEPVTYTIDIRSQTPVGGSVRINDKLPAGMTYLPNSLSVSTGTAFHEAATNTILWQGEIAPVSDAFLNMSTGYAWGDSDGDGDVQPVAFAWTDISSTGKHLLSGDDESTCTDIGFEFPFYDERHTTVCVHTDGYILFEEYGYEVIRYCPAPNGISSTPLIAGLWDNLVVIDGVYAEVLGAAPNRQLVVQWKDVQRQWLDSEPTTDFEVVLWERGDIEVRILRTAADSYDANFIGVQNRTGTVGTAYSCNGSQPLHDRLTVRFLPPGMSAADPNAQLTYTAIVDPGPDANQWITNTAVIEAAGKVYERSAALLANMLDLSTSQMTVSKPEVSLGERFGYILHLHNSGDVKAVNAKLTDPLPDALIILSDFIGCSSGTCVAEGSSLTWSGEILPDQTVTVAFSATLSLPLPDRTLVTNTAMLEDGYGGAVQIASSFRARRSELSGSFIEVNPAILNPGGRGTFTIFLHNSGGTDSDVEFSYALPAELIYEPGSLTCGDGLCQYDAGTIHWQGTLPSRVLVPVRFVAQVPPEIEYGHPLVSTIMLTDKTWQIDYAIPARIDVAHRFFLPEVHNPTSWLRLPLIMNRYIPFE